MKKIFLAILILLFSFSYAGRTIYGSTGYLMMPTGEGLKFQEYYMGLNAFSETADIKSHWKYYGGLGTAEGTEISFSGRSEREGLLLNMKWFGGLNNYENPLLVGMGFENISSLGTYGDYPAMYMVMTKKFLSGSSFSLGSAGRYINKEMIASLMFGFELFMNDSMSWVLDTISYKDAVYNVNTGLRFYTSNDMYFSVSVYHSPENADDPDEESSDPHKHPAVATIGLTINGFM